MTTSQSQIHRGYLIEKSLLTDKIFLLSLLVWGLNDHIFKYTMPGLVTGKLSDVTSLICAPVLLFIVLLNLYRMTISPWLEPESQMNSIVGRSHRSLMLFCACLMGSVMIGINLSPTWSNVYKRGLGLAQWPFYVVKSYVTVGHIPPIPVVKLTMDSHDCWTAPFAFVSLFILVRTNRKVNGSFNSQ